MPDFIQTDWIYGLVGGLMIGTAAAIYLLFNGRIMGASGIVGGLVDGTGRGSLRERGVFIAALIAVPALLAMAGAGAATNISGNWLWIILGGLCVGFGTRIANGCTSGHGVCGISRFSARGIVATLAYLFFGGATMAILRHVLGVL